MSCQKKSYKENIDVNIDNPNVYKLTKKNYNLIIKWDGVEIKIPKVLNGRRKEHQKTKTELKNLKLIPDAPPIGYGLQQFTGDIFYLYDINKTKKYVITGEEKLQKKEYRKKLILRKTCPRCGKIQKYLNDLQVSYISGQRYYLCQQCIDIKEEEVNQKRREVKHDFASYFINKGINLNEKIDHNEYYDIVYLDFETTGLSPTYDEIIQVSIIDNKDRVLMYKLCKPSKQNWDEAMDIHNITPKDVENELPFEAYINDISDILLRARTIVCYNCSFEIDFLNKYGVSYSYDSSYNKFQDCMLMFAKIYGEYSEYFGDYKWQKLTKAAKYYGYSFEGQEHNSLADVFALKFVYLKVLDKYDHLENLKQSCVEVESF